MPRRVPSDPSQPRLLARAPQGPLAGALPKHASSVVAEHQLAAKVSAIGLDGALEWVTVPTIECCNHVQLLPREDLIVHGSSCGRRLTFISGDGDTRAVHDLDEAPMSLFADGEGGAIVGFVDGGLAACDAGGKKKWTFDCPPVRRGIVESGVMYAVMVVKPGLLEVSAFELQGLR